MSDKKQLQSNEYRFPYHYIPTLENGAIQLSRRWGFAPSYIAALKLTEDWLRRIAKPSQHSTWEHIDLGCGDGAFIFYLNKLLKGADVRFSGSDFDEGAIQWAKMFNPGIEFYCDDISNLEKEKYRSASLIEVAEHIPPAELPEFVKSIADLLAKDGQLLVTVPHKNKRLYDKHFQHFSYESLAAAFEEYFEVVDVRGFEYQKGWNKLIYRFINTKRFYFEFPWLTNYYVKKLSKKHTGQKGVGRVIMELKKR